VYRGAAVVALALAAALAGASGSRSRARADEANAECTNNNDITLVVDFQDLGGGVNVRCAPQPVDSGRAAFSRTNTAMDDYQGFVCRIAGLPEEGPCNRYPPASAYWVYWVAARGGSWCTSNTGMDSRTPPPGTIEGWSFAKNKKKASLPPPRYPVPPPIAGTTPHPLNDGDCDATTSPTTTTTPSSRPSSQSPSPGGPPATSSDVGAAELPTNTTVRGDHGSRAASSSPAGSGAGAGTSTSVSALFGVDATTSTSRVPFGDVDLTVRHGDKGGGGGLRRFIVSVLGIGAVAGIGFGLIALQRTRQL
jgi:hypothetical protein